MRPWLTCHSLLGRQKKRAGESRLRHLHLDLQPAMRRFVVASAALSEATGCCWFEACGLLRCPTALCVALSRAVFNVSEAGSRCVPSWVTNTWFPSVCIPADCGHTTGTAAQENFFCSRSIMLTHLVSQARSFGACADFGRLEACCCTSFQPKGHLFCLFAMLVWRVLVLVGCWPDPD